ncbi:MAG: prenyltransferase [Dysgonamonadaceae bacterium]|jgi:1,4-dihydroxy-2-naphthoate octaprenyltransferase|nr:prenyltransferase [Dysgonamonadaceae bacterium]
MKKLTAKDWLFATRPWSFPASSMPALVSFLYMWYVHPESHQNLWLGIAAIVGAVIFHAGGNMISDYFDYKYGVDREGVPGTDNLTSKRFHPRQILTFGAILVGVGVILGLILVNLTGITLLWIGIVGFIGAVFYYKFKFIALGDLAIFIVYGPTIALGVGYVMYGAIDWRLLLLCLPIAFITVNILHANNTRDTKSDRQAGIKTFAMLIGVKNSIAEYVILTVMAYVLLIAMVAVRILPPFALIVLLTIPIAIRNSRAILKITEDNMSSITLLDVGTAQLQLVFSLSLSLALILSIIL